MKKVLFVCLGNICRSPAAEAVMQSMLKDAGLEDVVYCDSAGTSAYHSGERADSRMREHGKKRDYDLLSISRAFEKDDFKEFDLIIPMDQSNQTNMMQLLDDDSLKHKVKMMCSFCTKFSETEVPDPYYGGAQGFEHVFDILEDACSGLLKEIQGEL